MSENDADRLSPSELIAWRYAVKHLDLQVFTSKGATVPAEAATRDHELRGIVDGHSVNLTYERSRRLTIVRVDVLRPLLLGLQAHAFVPPKTPTGRSLGGFRTAHMGIDQVRINDFFNSGAEGRRLSDAMRELGVHGWVELTDHHVQAEVEVLARDGKLYTELIKRCVAIAATAVRAREALAPTPWETRLGEAFENAATAHRLRLAPDRLSLAGSIGGSSVELRLDAGKDYTLFGRAFFPAKLPHEPFVEPRRGLLSKLRVLLRRGPTRSRRFNWLFEASPDIESVLPEDALDMFVALMSRSAAAALDASAVRYRTSLLDIDPTKLLDELSALRTAIANRAPASPYR